MTEDEMVGWHYQLDEYEFEQALGVDDGQGSLACSVHAVAKSQLFASGDQSIGASNSASVFPMSIYC